MHILTVLGSNPQGPHMHWEVLVGYSRLVRRTPIPCHHIIFAHPQDSLRHFFCSAEINHMLGRHPTTELCPWSLLSGVDNGDMVLLRSSGYSWILYVAYAGL